MRAYSDLGDFLYILLIVAFGIIGSIGKAKKKKRAFATDSDEEKMPTIWDELKKEMRGESDQEVYEEAYESEYNTSKEQERSPIIASDLERRETYTYTDANLKRESVEYTEKEAMPVITVPPRIRKRKKNKIQFKFDSIDELRKGIIYSEIFNRKYM